MMNNMLNGMFGKVAPGMCRLSMNGGIAVKTGNGYKTYNMKTGRLTNCDSFVFNIGEEFFFVIPTNKAEPGDILLVAGKPKCVIEAEKNNNLDEDEFEKTHKTLSLALYVPSVLMPWLFVCFGFSVTYNFGIESPYILMDLIIFILELAWVTILQYQIVEQTKKILPEKRGNVLDSKFQKEWYSSCDEAEKQIIGEACYISYKTMNMVYPILFAIMIFVCSLYDLSPFIFLMVGVLWLIQILSYLIPSYRLEHGKQSRR